VNGKTRGTISVPATATQADAIAAVMAEPSIARFVTAPTKRVIFVKGRMVNLVT
jgi:leucyl-tRNA synthetase